LSRTPDRIGVIFDEPSLVADAGLIVPATLVVRLGLERLIDETVRLAGRVGGAGSGRKVLTLVFSILAGGSHIDHADRLRSGATRRVLPFSLMAPSTLGIFLRCFTFGHVRQLDKVIGEATRRAWSAGAGPGGKAMVIDVDSSIVPVHGHKKHGASYGYTRQLGYHPLLAVRADTGEVLHGRLRRGSANTQRGVGRFTEELIARVRRAGATVELTLRADSGFYSGALIGTLVRLGVRYSITVGQNDRVKAAVAQIPEAAWRPIVYPDGGEAAVAETTLIAGRRAATRTLRLVVRRTRLTDPKQQQLWPDWQHHCFVTDVDLDAAAADVFHREHATVELAIRDLKEGAGLEHCPSGHFFANAAWLGCAILAHDLTRWTARLGAIGDRGCLTVAATVRRQLFAVPGRLVNRSGRLTLRFPQQWPWEVAFLGALGRIRSLPLIT
jgi:hypothetical protein